MMDSKNESFISLEITWRLVLSVRHNAYKAERVFRSDSLRVSEFVIATEYYILYFFFQLICGRDVVCLFSSLSGNLKFV